MSIAPDHVSAPRISLRDVTKVYPGPVTAIDAVSVGIEPGTIHAFVGENGAGKSTLMKVLSGEVRPDRGSVMLNDRVVRLSSARDAMDLGIGIVHQEILLVNELTVWENVVLGAEPVTYGFLLDKTRGRSAVQASIDRFGLDLDPDALVGSLSLAARQKTEICKLLHRDVSVLILDEPTAVLTPQEVPKFFDELRRLARTGRTICFISHHLDEVMELSDTVSVLRDGRLVETCATATTSIAALTRRMIDRDVVFTTRRTDGEFGDVILRVSDVCVVERELQSLGPIDMDVRSGEIVGVAGVDGNGQRELVEAILGVRATTGGSIRVAGVEIAHQNILERRRAIAYVPAERKTAGASINSSVTENTLMTHHRLGEGFARLGGWLVKWKRSREFAEEVRDRFDVELNDVSQNLGSLSGGNQQKVILGRELSMLRPLTILDQPTRGLDVGSIEYVHQSILDVRARGGAVLLVSSDLEELLRLSDTIVVLFRGRIVDRVGASEATLDRLGTAMLQGSNP